MSTDNRRRHARIPHRLPLQLTHDVHDLITKTENVSASGAYCIVKRYVAPMTKLQVRLEIPGQTHLSVKCEGVVVRTDPPQPDPKRHEYSVAIFFQDISERDRTTLAHYIDQHIKVDTAQN